MQNLETVFRIEYFVELQDRRENTERIWETVKDEIKNLIEEWGSLSFSTLQISQKNRIENILGKETQSLLDDLQKIVSQGNE